MAQTLEAYSVPIALAEPGTGPITVVVCSGSHEEKVNLGEVFPEDH